MAQSYLEFIFEHVLLTSSVTLLAAGILLQVIRCYRHPLSHIPGSFGARTSRAPLFYQSLRGRRIHWIREQHARYGPVVLISPTKVCVASDEGIKKVYSNKASKSHMYDAFKYQDVKMCIGLLDVKSAHARRKGLLPAFSRQNLMEIEPVIRLHLERFLEWLKKFDQMNQSIDVFKWFRYLTFDVVMDIAFGQQIGMLVSEDTHFITQIEHRNKRNGLVRCSESQGAEINYSKMNFNR
jgi:cytochrome P450